MHLTSRSRLPAFQSTLSPESPRSAAAQTGTATILVFDFQKDAEAPVAASPDAVRGELVDAAGQGALQAAGEAVEDVSRRATEQPPQLAPASATASPPPAQPLRVMYSPSEEIPEFQLDVSSEHMDSLVVYCYVTAGRDALARLGRAILNAVVPPLTIHETVLRHQIYGRGKPVQPSPVFAAFTQSMTKLDQAVSRSLSLIAAQSVTNFEARLGEVSRVTKEEAGRYAIEIVTPTQSPQGGGAEGGQGGSGATSAAGGGSGTESPTSSPQTFRSRTGTAGDRARELVDVVAEVGALADAHDAAQKRLENLDETRKLEAEALKEGSPSPLSTNSSPSSDDWTSQSGESPSSPAESTSSPGKSEEAADPFREKLTQQVASSREQWLAKLAQISQKPGEPVAGEEAARSLRYHPLLPGILAFCLTAKPDDERYSESNVLRQALRYFETLTMSARNASFGRRSVDPLVARLTSVGTLEIPEITAARWAVEKNKPYAVEPFASDAILSMVKRSFAGELGRAGTDDELVAAFNYRVLVSYWEALIAEREKVAKAAAERNDWWTQPTAKVSASLGLAGLFVAPAAAASAVIGIGALLVVMLDAVLEAETAAGKARFEAVIAGDDTQIAIASAENPLAWQLFTDVGSQMAALQALGVVAPGVALLYGAYQDFATVVDE